MTQPQYVVFKTNTILDIRAITTFGLNAKPNSKSPIGYFGTGLKMAIAVLVRHKIPVTLYIGSAQYEFYLKEEDFRNTKYQSVRMRRRGNVFQSWGYTRLPFTSELAKNWSLWQAFRELESNTRDENGLTITDHDGMSFLGHADQTTIVIGPSEEFAAVYGERDKIFLPEALQQFEWGNGRLQIFRKPSNYLYYRGIRVKDLDKPSIFTYNVLEPVELTEDRTIKYEYSVKEVVRRFLSQSDDAGLINHLLNVTDRHWEATLDWDSEYNEKPSATFIDVLARRNQMAKRAAGKEVILPRFTTMYSHAVPRSPTEKPISEQFEDWYTSNDVRAYLDEPTRDAFHDLVNKLKGRDL